ncbi:MAG: hypothetical protein U1E70_24535 [Acetobacteraceae bacterium]
MATDREQQHDSVRDASFPALTDPILLALLALAVGLLILGCLGGLMPRAVTGGLAALLCGAGAALCVLTLVAQLPAVVLQLPVGPPGLPLALALDAVAALFLLVMLLCGAALTTATAMGDSASAQPDAIALVLGGLTMAALGGGAVVLALGLAAAAAGLWRLDPSARPLPMIGAAMLLLAALCLMAPAGLAPDFLPMLAAAPSAWRQGVAAAATLAAGVALLAPYRLRSPSVPLLAGVVVPAILYLLTRLLIDLPLLTDSTWWGAPMLLLGTVAAVVYGWRAAGASELGNAIDAIIRQQAAIAGMGLGLCIINAAADLPIAAALALAGTALLSLTAAAAGTLAGLCVEAIVRSAGSGRLARLGGIRETMPATAILLALALLVLSSLPPGGAFAGLWLLAQAILGGPRSGGLLAQAPLALAAAGLAASATLATVASLRMIGIVLLGRPRSARAAGAQDISRGQKALFAALAAVAILQSLLPGGVVRILVQPLLVSLTGTGLGGRAGWMTLSASPHAPGYATLPVLALLLLAAGGVLLATRRYRLEARLSAVWTDGQPPEPTLPFGDPLAQSAGTGFRPALPHMPLRMPILPRLPFHVTQLATAQTGLWTMLVCLGGLLLLGSLFGTDGP